MIVDSRHFLIFLALAVGVECFTNTFTISRSISFQTKKIFEPKQVFGLKGLENESIETDIAPDAVTDDAAADDDAVTDDAVIDDAVTDDAVTDVAVTDDAVTDDAVTDDDTTEEKKEVVKPVEDITKIAYVVNLSYDTPGYQLREICNQHGTVQKLFMPKEKGNGRTKGIAFVTMSSEEERDVIIEKLNDTEVDGRTIYVDKAKPRSEKSAEKKDPTNKKLYVGNISYETSKEDLIEFFTPYGIVRDVYIPNDRETGAPRGFAFVTMKSEAADIACEKATGIELQGRIIEVKESLPRGQKAPVREKKVSNDIKIYVGNLSFDTEEETIRACFEEFGELTDLYIPLDRDSGRPRGFAFVTMGRDGAANAIEATDGLEMDGRVLRVNEAQPKGYSTQKYDDWDEEGEWGEEE